MSFANIVNVMPLAREGNRALAITSIKRSPLAPDLPTMGESGFLGFEAVPWFGLLAPSGNKPTDVLDKLHAKTVKALAIPEVRKKFDALGLEPIGNTPSEFAAVIRKETPEWAKVIKDAGIKSATSPVLEAQRWCRIVGTSPFVGQPDTCGTYRMGAGVYWGDGCQFPRI